MNVQEPQGWPHAGSGLTVRLVEQALAVRASALPPDVQRVARDCLVDWLGCAFAAVDEPVSRIVAATVRDEGGQPQACLLGQAFRGTTMQAALLNGTTSHALDYDDVNLTMPGHLSAAILPALLALAEQRRASVEAFIGAFVAGYEFACRVGELVEPAHYANGFHATATVGGLGAAMACAHLLDLSRDTACHAIGLAATQAAGLKAMFGSMAKPLHAGLASQAAVRAVLLAQRGLTARPDSLECAQGFVQVHGSDCHVEAALKTPENGYHLLHNLFKFHAACYSVHSTIDATRALRERHALVAGSVSMIRVVAGTGCSICNIQWPRTGLEAKFSLRASAAFALLDVDTSRLDVWDRVTEPAVDAVLRRVEVELVPGMGLSDSVVTVVAADGTGHTLAWDCGAPIADKAAQTARVFAKFRSIATPMLGAARIDEILALAEQLEEEADLGRLVALCGAPPLFQAASSSSSQRRNSSSDSSPTMRGALSR